MLPVQEAQVRSLVGELRSRKQHSTVKKKKKSYTGNVTFPLRVLKNSGSVSEDVLFSSDILSSMSHVCYFTLFLWY